MTALTISSGVFAQHEGHDMEKKKPVEEKKEQQMDMKKDHVMMHDGKMQMVKNGKTIPMEEDMTMSNGTTVMTDGMCKMKNGKTMQMKEGDMMDMNGKMGKMPMKTKKGKMKM